MTNNQNQVRSESSGGNGKMLNSGLPVNILANSNVTAKLQNDSNVQFLHISYV